MVTAKTDTAPELRICPVRASYTAGEPVEVLLVLRGRDGPVAMNNRPDSYEYIVVDEKGDTLQPVDTFHAILHFGERGALTLPARGALSRVVDLNCMRPSLVAPDTLFPACWAHFSFAPGEYTVTVSWQDPLDGLAGVEFGSDIQRLSSSPIRIRVR